MDTPDPSFDSIIEPHRGWFDWRLGQLWRYRDLVSLFVWRDFVSVHKQTILGPAWHILQPLFTTIIFTMVFSRFARLSTDGAPPFLFYMAGTVAWAYFASCLDNTAKTFVANAQLLGKVYFHRLVIPVSIVISSLITFGIQLGIFLVFLAGYVISGSAVHLTGWVLSTPILLLMLAGYGLGGGIIVCAMTTKYRDLRHVLTFGIQLLMYLTPVIYPISAVPERYQWIARLNPLTPVIEGFRRGFLGVGSVTETQLAISFGFMLLVLATGMMLFTRVERTFMDTGLAIMSTVISVEHVSKIYRLGAIGGASLNEDLARWVARVRGKPDPALKVDEQHLARRIGQQFSALSDISFNVKDGEVLGIVGRNGAGKSTLLKILAQVTGPTSGRIRIKGRVASLLEVGTGFHPDLTGRENVFLNGAIMGMTKAEIRRKFDEIVAFSECGEFIDTPVKRYSSGMYVRLAFAVAGHLEPEILIVDEVLAVGDAQFQKKCLGKMSEVSRGGRTVLFVSHNMVAVQSLCHSALLLQDGRLVTEGPTASVVSAYLRDAYRREETTAWSTVEEAPGNDLLRVKQVQITPLKEAPDGLIGMDSPVRIDTDFWVLKPSVQLHLTYHLVSDEGTIVLTTGCQPAKRPAGLHRASFTLPGNLLNSGGYSLKFLLIQNENRLAYQHDALASFAVVDTAERQLAYLGREPGAVQPPLSWTEASLEGSQVALTS